MNSSSQKHQQESSRTNNPDDNDDASMEEETASLPSPQSKEQQQQQNGSHHRTIASRQFDSDLLERFGRWLLQIPRNDVLELNQTRAYSDFVVAFEQLTKTHCELMNREEENESHTSSEKNSIGGSSFLLQHLLIVDDVVLRILEFLSCSCLIRVSMTCRRFNTLAKTCAHQQTLALRQERQITNIFRLLRAKEQMDGSLLYEETSNQTAAVVVPVPMLGLKRRVLVTSAGDAEYNGIYYCTSTNGNGFVFTKPRTPPRRHPKKERLLQCIIAKRFSNETILWYMSKEEVENNDNNSTQQVFSFWCKLMVIGDASEELCQYPSQTSVILSREDDNDAAGGWQPLDDARLMQPPIVELLD